MINVNIIRAFEGPRHAVLERVWSAVAELNSDRMNLHVFNNLGARLSHAEAYNQIWEQEAQRPERFAIFTEFDFLPSKGFLKPPEEAVEAATYCTRDSGTRNLVWHGYPGAWFILCDKQRLVRAAEPVPGVLQHHEGGRGEGVARDPRLLLRLRFDPSGPHNDPANGLADYCRRTLGVSFRLLPGKDCFPRHYGVEVVGRGEHLFWSRHYNDPPHLRVAGFGLGDIQRKVDAVVREYADRLPRL